MSRDLSSVLTFSLVFFFGLFLSLTRWVCVPSSFVHYFYLLSVCSLVSSAWVFCHLDVHFFSLSSLTLVFLPTLVFIRFDCVFRFPFHFTVKLKHTEKCLISFHIFFLPFFFLSSFLHFLPNTQLVKRSNENNIECKYKEIIQTVWIGAKWCVVCVGLRLKLPSKMYKWTQLPEMKFNFVGKVFASVGKVNWKKNDIEKEKHQVQTTFNISPFFSVSV